MKGLIELINALGPFLQYVTPLLLVLIPLWINRQNKKIAAAQTTALMAHSDGNAKKIVENVTSASGLHKILPEAQPPDAR